MAYEHPKVSKIFIKKPARLAGWQIQIEKL
jgi:hypothetical protein